jgi:hypothetical protein
MLRSRLLREQREKNRGREKPEPQCRGPHLRDIILGEKKAREFLATTTRARTRAHAFLGAQNTQKAHKGAAERIDDANYMRVFFLGYETPKDARR